MAADSRRMDESYREFGFKIEPQVASGECTHADDVQECKGIKSQGIGTYLFLSIRLLCLI